MAAKQTKPPNLPQAGEESGHNSPSEERPLGAGRRVKVWELVEVRVEGSADDQPPHLTGPGPNLIQLGISQKAAHGKVIDVAIATCSQGVGREERTTGKVMGNGQSKRSQQKAEDTETGQTEEESLIQENQQKVVSGRGVGNPLLGRTVDKGPKGHPESRGQQAGREDH